MVGCLQGVQWCPCVTFWSFHYRCTNTLVLFFGVFTSRKKCHPQQQQKSLPNRYKNPKKHPTKNEKKTQDITMSPLIFSHYFSSNPTHQLHTQKNTLPGRGSYHASLLGWSWGCSDFPGAQIHGDDMCFSLGKKMVWLVVSMIFYFHPENWGRWTHFDEHIFQMGWFNHQPVVPFQLTITFFPGTLGTSPYIYIYTLTFQSKSFLEPIIFPNFPILKGTGRISTSRFSPGGWKIGFNNLRLGEQHWAWSKPHVTWLLGFPVKDPYDRTDWWLR